MNINTLVKRRPLISYFVLAYGITWGGIFLFLASRGFQLSTITAQDVPLVFLPMILGPSVSSLLLTALLDGRGGVRDLWTRLTHWRVGWMWYAVAPLTIEGQSWVRFAKPPLTGAGEWSHWEHGPDNNPVSEDAIIKFPYMTQYLQEPFYIAMPSITTSAGGRT